MIPIRNVYYMLSYVFHKLKDGGYVRCSTEDFPNVVDLLAEILIHGISVQLKRGLEKGYHPITENTQSLRGKINLSESVRTLSRLSGRMVCEYDCFDENCYRNRILKTTMLLLLRQNICHRQKQGLRKLLHYFRDVEEIAPQLIHWRQQYNRNNESYQLLMGICSMILRNLLQTQEDGSMKLKQFFDDKDLCRLYEKFILNYFRREHPELRSSSEQIAWALVGNRSPFLPVMQSDVILRAGQKTLIIDAKYYANNLQNRYGDSHSIHSNNLYQIYTYVDNYRKLHPDEEVSGMLLYARTDALLQPDSEIPLHDITISIRTLDLNQEFRDIAAQLDRIADTLM